MKSYRWYLSQVIVQKGSPGFNVVAEIPKDLQKSSGEWKMELSSQVQNRFGREFMVNLALRMTQGVFKALVFLICYAYNTGERRLTLFDSKW